MTAGRSLALLAALGAVGCRGRTDRRHDDGAAGRHDAGVAPLANDASAADALAPESAGTIPADGARDGGVDADPYELATGRPRTLADRVGLYAARADVLIEDALMLTLRERLLLVRGVYPDGERFLPGTEQRIKALLAARCGAVVKDRRGRPRRHRRAHRPDLPARPDRSSVVGAMYGLDGGSHGDTRTCAAVDARCGGRDIGPPTRTALSDRRVTAAWAGRGRR